MKKIQVIYDVEKLKSINTSSSSRSGITLSAYWILLHLAKICDVKLYARLEYFEMCKAAFAKNKQLCDLEFVPIYPLYQRIVSKMCHIKYHLLFQKYTQNKKILLDIINTFTYPAVFLSRILRLNASKIRYLEQSQIFFSPYDAIPKEIQASSLVCFTLLHDAIPLVLDEYFMLSQSRFDIWLRSILPLRQKHDFYYLVDSLNTRDYYFTNSTYTKQDFLAHCGDRLESSHMFVTLLGVDSHIFHRDFDTAKNQSLKEKYHIPKECKYIFSLCSLDPRKNLIFVATQFVAFITKHKIEDLVLVLGGGEWGVFQEKLESSIAGFGAYAHKVIRAGYVDDADLANLFSHSLCSVYLSLYEGFGLPALEAMACGAPLIVSATTSLPEVVGEGGILLEPNDTKGLQEAYKQMYYDANLREELRAKALKQASAFSWEKCANEMNAAFVRVLESKAKRDSLDCASKNQESKAIKLDSSQDSSQRKRV